MSRSKLIDMVEWKAVIAAERLCRVSAGPDEDTRVPHLGVVLAAWDPAAAATSVQMVLERLRELERVKSSMVVVANNDDAARALAPANGEYRLVLGSNTEAEFSAYEEGRRALAAGAGTVPDAWAVLNDRLPYYKADADCLVGITPALLRFARSVPIAAGKLDFLARDYQLFGHKLRCYIRSNYIFLSAPAMDCLGSLCAISADEYAREVPIAFPGQDWPLSDWLGPGLGHFLKSFLTEPGAESWARAEPLTEESWPRLRMKALSIVNEWLLSLRLIEAEVPLVPWLLARAMSRLRPSGAFCRRLLGHYKVDPAFGGALEWSPEGRLSLAAAVLASRAGATRTAETLLGSAARSSTAVRRPHEMQGT